MVEILCAIFLPEDVRTPYESTWQIALCIICQQTLVIAVGGSVATTQSIVNIKAVLVYVSNLLINVLLEFVVQKTNKQT